MMPSYISLLVKEGTTAYNAVKMANPHVTTLYFGSDDDLDAGERFAVYQALQAIAPLIEPFSMNALEAGKFGDRFAIKLHSCQASVIRESLMTIPPIEELATYALQHSDYSPHLSIGAWDSKDTIQGDVMAKILDEGVPVDRIRFTSGTFEHIWQLREFARR